MKIVSLATVLLVSMTMAAPVDEFLEHLERGVDAAASSDDHPPVGPEPAASVYHGVSLTSIV